MEIVSIANKKGGVGKTTTVMNLTVGLVKRGKNVLAIDLDSQANFSKNARANKDVIGIYEVLCDGSDINDAIQNNGVFDFVAADTALTGAAKFLPNIGTEFVLKKAIEQLKRSYDYIVIDTPPNVEHLTVNALVASDVVIIPTIIETFALDGIIQLYKAINDIKNAFDKTIRVDGILYTTYEPRLNITKTLEPAFRSLADTIETKIYNTAIGRCVALKEAQTIKSDIFTYEPDSQGAKDYNAFVDEFLDGGKA